MTNRIRVFLDKLIFPFGPINKAEDGIMIPVVGDIYNDEGFDNYPEAPPRQLTTHEAVLDDMTMQKDSLYDSERSLVEQINDRMERLWSVRRSIRAVEAGIEQMRQPYEKPKPLALLAPPEPKRQPQEMSA